MSPRRESPVLTDRNSVGALIKQVLSSELTLILCKRRVTRRLVLFGFSGLVKHIRVSSEMSVSVLTTTTGDNEAGGGPAMSALIGWARNQYRDL